MIGNIIIGIMIALLGYAIGDLLGERRGRNGKCHDVTIEGMTFEGCEYKLVEEWQNVTVEVCKCRKCGAAIATDTTIDFLPREEQHYCYFCGAKMDGKEIENVN